ncbi:MULTISPECIES: GNAT family N-acetyltransferase [Methylobacterium]|jgi:ribosomal protein S18 acetylase RimI-like enzyme|uniref:GCN5 family acetyltransferase n=3 Tax=Methylobacterium TaxID=407 RepID=A0AAE8L563_9HYPH|nr:MULTISPECIES: GNAT family N-acetyltransferase [Methylobacterium]KOX58377.1 GCN5 family acetyltransferase [Streptomyces purpurogeneiscleroticus]AIQ91930.1 GCN5-related N-acetyltransferase [Methylobacterium oryzae CBMB20]APT32425.1 GCN5 family acetyltransferase [Methylobacterium phyllosphaerae]AWV16347.1 GNAT family N-acetyltransferase [Methylobacterium sp. XJLW]MBA9065082.1 ribosomal protein S18 acetylase RimI-like enzyme [Methylobacterium fujisawaense]
MSTRTTSIRRAREADLGGLSKVFDASWREAYRGIIPGVALERVISTRDRAWWQSALRRGRPIAVVETGELVVGYAAYGRTRSRALGTEAEIDELYLLPEYQGVGLGRRLFRAVRNDLADHGLTRLGVWSLEDNVRAGAFYEGLGGVAGPRALDRVAGIPLPKVGFLFG